MRTKSVWIATLLGTACVLTGALLFANHAKAAGTDTTTANYVPKPKGALTFTKDIAPIMLQNCASCHRAGEIAPFSLESYQDAKKRAAQLASVTQSRYMPPWHADSHGEFVDERKLTPEQIGEIKQWADEGAPEGDPAAMPPLPTFPQGWSLGKPDMILTPSKAYTMAAEGGDVYRCFVMPTNLTEDRYVAAMEVHPGNSKIVHHVIAYLDTKGGARKLEEASADGQAGYSSGGGIGVTPAGALGGWAPGNLPRLLPDGVGIRMQKASDVVLQVHYHASGKKESDQTQIGIYFAKKPVDKRLHILPVFGALNIPAGDAHYATQGTWPLPITEAISIIEVMPHMHLLGRDMTVTATLPDQKQETLVKVPDWDFNWQTTYMYKEPLKLPANTKISLVAHYDNSTANPRNPNNPPKPIHWGEQTTDEMCLAFVYYTIDSEQITKGIVKTDMLDLIGGGLGGGAGRRLRNRQQPATNP